MQPHPDEIRTFQLTLMQNAVEHCKPHQFERLKFKLKCREHQRKLEDVDK